jgi:hypothetical protein
MSGYETSGDGIHIWALAAATLPDGTLVVAAGDSNGRVTWWNGASGELLSDSISVDPVVVRSMTVARLPDGRIRFATVPEFENPGSGTRDLGSEFTQKVFDQADPREDQALPEATPPVHDQASMQIDRVRQEATAAATNVRSHHLLHTYAGLLPANPRMIKRVANALGMLEAVRIHGQHAEDDDAMARADPAGPVSCARSPATPR